VTDPLASRIDHTLLAPAATSEQISAAARLARDCGCASLCINPAWVTQVAAILRGSATRVCTVIGFPLGADAPGIKAAEARRAVADGAEELDMVIALGALVSGDRDDQVQEDIASVVAAAEGRPVKVIIESHLLTDAQIERACRLSLAAGAAFVKTCTGFSGGGATEHAVRLMRRCVGDRARVKASGGIRDRATAETMVAAGADRLGCSATQAILAGATAAGGY
jgi:deoxyribose-phosphate aldolase